MTRTADTVLAHFGVKGMKWGVRKDRGHEGERVKTKQLKKLDKKWEKENTGRAGFIKAHNAAADKMNNGEIDRINNKPEYDEAAKRGDLMDFNKPITQKYHAEMESAFNKAFAESLVAIGSNPSGTKRYQLEVDQTDGEFGARLVATDVKHSAEDNMPDYKVAMNSKAQFGKVTLDNSAEHSDRAGDFLAHYGVKGMKWGVRREKNPVEVTPKTAPGRKVKASGGSYHTPSEDAIRAAVIRQQAKKSTTDSLSNKELQDLVTRMNLEAQYKNLNQNNVSIGKKFARVILGQVADQEVRGLQDFASDTTKKTKFDKNGNRQNDAKTNFAVKVGVAGAKSVAGVNGGKKK